MTTVFYQTVISDYGLLAIHGEDAGSFLQGLVSNDVLSCPVHQAVFAAMLTPQGKFLHSFLIYRQPENVFWLMTRQDRCDDALKRLKIYKLKAKVQLENISDQHNISCLWPAVADISHLTLPENAILFQDPRTTRMGHWMITTRNIPATISEATPASLCDWNHHRIQSGIPESGIDLKPERSILLENGFDELNGVHWKKGCYVGQELTARTKYRNLIRKRLIPIIGQHPFEPDHLTIWANDQEAGEITSFSGNFALAMIRLPFIQQALSGDVQLRVQENAPVTPAVPEWLDLQRNAATD